MNLPVRCDQRNRDLVRQQWGFNGNMPEEIKMRESSVGIQIDSMVPKPIVHLAIGDCQL